MCVCVHPYLSFTSLLSPSRRFKGSLRDLGRVRCSRPIAPRADPEGNAGEEEDGAAGAGGGGAGPGGAAAQTPEDVTPCTESKPFSVTPLQVQGAGVGGGGSGGVGVGSWGG